MIELLSREEVLNQNKTLAALLVEIQVACFDPSERLSEPGEGIDAETFERRYFSQEECDEMNRVRIEEYERKRDKIDAPPLNESIARKFITHESTVIDECASGIGDGLRALAEDVLDGSLTFILEYAKPWLDQDHDYPKVLAAFDFLKSCGVTKEYAGAIRAAGSDLRELSIHLFWLARCNGIPVSCWFSGPKEEFAASFCKYGNLHSFFYSKLILAEFEKGMERWGLIEQDDCYERFSETGGIEGRRMIR